MSKSRSIPREPLEPVESFEDRLAVLAEELDLAIHWQRPSILLVFYESEYVRAEVELALQKGLTKTGQQVVEITVDESQFDVPLLLSRRPDRERSVYSITGLSWGGGRQDANAYRALNMRREFFVDYQIRAVFWLDKDEAAELPQQAPDFWAFRHRVVEFYDPPDRQALAFQVEEPAAPGPARPELGEEIVSAEARLACLPEVQESLQARLDSLGKLAGLYREKPEPFQAVKHLKLALQLVRPTGDEKMSARLWGQLGQIYLDLGDQNRAVRAFRKAIRLLPDEAAFWKGLGQTYLAGGRAAAARASFRKAMRFVPEDPSGWTGLGQAQAQLGHLAEAAEAFQEAIRLAPGEAGIWVSQGNFLLDLGRFPEARQAFKKAVELAPEAPRPWLRLGLLLQTERRFSDAIIAYQHVISLDPHNMTAHISLLACYRRIGREDLAEAEIGWVRARLENENEYQHAVFESVCGNAPRAIEWLALAVQKKQAGPGRLRHDPNLSNVRNDPHFSELIERN